MKYELTLTYMGTTTSQIVPEAELNDHWTFVDIAEDVRKPSGQQFEDSEGSVDEGVSPLDWKDGKATETGCGPWRGDMRHDTLNGDTLLRCDSLLKRAGMKPLVIAPNDPGLKQTFDVLGVNADALEALDQAQWWVEAVEGSDVDDKIS